MKKTVYFLLVFVAGIVYSCREDEGNHNHHPHEKSNTGYKRSIVSFAEMKARLPEGSARSLAVFDNVTGRGGDGYIKEIDSTYIISYANDTLATYTLRVKTLDEENYSYSNLIIRTINGETEEFIAHYAPTAQWQEAHDNGEDLEYDGAFDLVDTNGNPILIGNEEGTQARSSGCWV